MNDLLPPLSRRPGLGATVKPPKDLKPTTKRWFSHVLEEFALEPHHIKILTLAARCWDRAEAASEAIRTLGMTYTDRFNCPRLRPEVRVESDARTGFLRALRELDLDIASPDDANRPPPLRSNRG